MSKNITIQEGGIAKSLTVDKLKTDLVGGGTCNWVPEDETQLITKSVTKNGTYEASSDGAHGYSKVIVNVAGGSVTGKGSDGNTHTYNVDGQGNIEDEVVPDTIVVTTLPTNPYGIYQNGQTITKDGMVVKAYNADETEYGTVPLDEITISPTTAVYDPSTDPGPSSSSASIDDTTGLDADTIAAMPIVFGSNVVYTGLYNTGVTGAPGGGVTDLVNSSPVYVFTARHDGFDSAFICSKQYFSGKFRTFNQYGDYDRNISPSSFTVNGETVYFDTLTSGETFNSCTPGQNGKISSVNAAYIILYGTQQTIPAGSRQTITVTWPRPGDGKELTTTFEIRVAPGYTPGDNTEL